MKVGDSVGGIYKVIRNGIKQWELIEDKITKIVENKKGRMYHTKIKFYPLDADDIDSNTEIQEEANGYILTNEVFGLTEINRTKTTEWIIWSIYFLRSILTDSLVRCKDRK